MCRAPTRSVERRITGVPPEFPHAPRTRSARASAPAQLIIDLDPPGAPKNETHLAATHRRRELRLSLPKRRLRLATAPNFLRRPMAFSTLLGPPRHRTSSAGKHLRRIHRRAAFPLERESSSSDLKSKSGCEIDGSCPSADNLHSPFRTNRRRPRNPPAGRAMRFTLVAVTKYVSHRRGRTTLPPPATTPGTKARPPELWKKPRANSPASLAGVYPRGPGSLPSAGTNCDHLPSATKWSTTLPPSTLIHSIDSERLPLPPSTEAQTSQTQQSPDHVPP